MAGLEEIGWYDHDNPAYQQFDEAHHKG